MNKLKVTIVALAMLAGTVQAEPTITIEESGDLNTHFIRLGNTYILKYSISAVAQYPRGLIVYLKNGKDISILYMTLKEFEKEMNR